MNAAISAARQSQKSKFRSYDACGHCKRPLSIAEVIERHCEECGSTTVREVRQ